MANRWQKSEQLTEIDWQDACLSVLKGPAGVTIVRPKKDGTFAVLEISGDGRARVLKVLPTSIRARSYNFALQR